MAGLDEIPAVVMTGDDLKIAEVALIENVQRKDLNPIEEAMAYKALIERFGLKQEEVAQQAGKSRSSVANMLRLLELPDEVLTLGKVDSRLAPYRGVNTGKKGGRYLDVVYPPKVGSGGKAGYVSHHTAAKGDEDIPSCDAVLGKKGKQLAVGGEIFGPLTVWNYKADRFKACSLKRVDNRF